MKKRIISSFLALLIVTIVMVSPVDAKEPIKIKVDGEYVQTDVDPFIENNRTYVPVRFISEKLGATVEWDTEAYDTPAIIIYTEDPDSLWLTLFVDKHVALVSEAAYWSDAPAIIKNNRTMVPLRFIASYLGCDVEWDADSRTVILTSTGDYSKFDAFYDDEASEKISDWLIDYNHTTEQFLEILK
jgi:hypothetical protein